MAGPGPIFPPGTVATLLLLLLLQMVCMHEEDVGLLWKHVEYRNGYSESRRSRRLVVSFISTVVNYEYAFYWSVRSLRR